MCRVFVLGPRQYNETITTLIRIQNMNLRWIPHVTTSAIHAAEALWRGQTIVDEKLAEVIDAPARLLAQEIAARGVPEARFWRNLAGLAPTFDNARQAVKIAAYRAGGARLDEPSIMAIAGPLLDMERAVDAAFPNLTEELALRGRVFREMWESRGPGMLSWMEKQFEQKILVPGADVLLVQPALGGDGKPNLVNNSVVIEAVLANPHQRLPEIVRLAWLLSQLNLDLPAYSENIHPDRLPHIAGFAMLPVTLQAAQEVELIQFDRETFDLALSAWRLKVPADVDAPDLLSNWWLTYQESKPTLAIALQALDEMFG